MSQQPLPYYILFDSETSQVEQQAQTGTRLNTLYGALTSVFGVATSGGAAESPLAFTPVSTGPSYGPITPELLEGKKLLAILTRWSENPPPSGQPPGYAPFSSGELNAIQQFVSGGGGLLLMANHGPFPTNPTNWTVNDMALASQFGFTIDPVGISNNTGLMWMSGGNFLPSGAPQIFSGVTSIVAHDGCAVSPGTSSPGIDYFGLVEFPSGAFITLPSGPIQANQYFAAGAKYFQGKVVIVANSGMIADVGNTCPAAGISAYGSNLLFVLNAFSWLADIPAWNPQAPPCRPFNGG